MSSDRIILNVFIDSVAKSKKWEDVFGNAESHKNYMKQIKNALYPENKKQQSAEQKCWEASYDECWERMRKDRPNRHIFALL